MSCCRVGFCCCNHLLIIAKYLNNYRHPGAKTQNLVNVVWMVYEENGCFFFVKLCTNYMYINEVHTYNIHAEHLTSPEQELIQRRSSACSRASRFGTEILISWRRRRRFYSLNFRFLSLQRLEKGLLKLLKDFLGSNSLSFIYFLTKLF